MTFEPGVRVRHFDNPGRQGTVLQGVRHRPSGTYREVRWDDGNKDFVLDDQLEHLEANGETDPDELARQGKFARAADFRRNLTYVYLSGKLANLVYSMGITNTDFYPHQYRPLLTLLDSAVNGLLIADEVGLGKTIEAGLIWTELRARYNMQRLLVVCPAMLCEKWHDELISRFGVDASIVNSTDLMRVLKHPINQLGEGKAWIISYNSLRPPRDWREDNVGEKQKNVIQNIRWQICNLFKEQADMEPLFDLVIYDEAHYMRNKDTATWRLGNLLSSISEYQIMLSATPINLHDDDLFNLLQLLDPNHFQWVSDFKNLLEANTYLVRAYDAILNKKNSIKHVRAILEEASFHPFLSNYKQLNIVINDHLKNDNMILSDKMRSYLSSVIEKMNLISYIITRTRKRDVLNKRIIRNVNTEAVQMTEAEKDIYYRVTSAIEEYSRRKNISSGFLVVSPQRRITSCPAATLNAWIAEDNTVMDDFEEIEIELNKQAYRPLSKFIGSRVADINLEELKNNDSKFNKLKEIAVRFIKENPEEKVILFTTFRATAKYLSDRLNEVDIRSKLLLGGMRQSKQEIINEFRENSALRFLISTEVAAEGVDLQFCRFLINYDLPWNPTRIEQRIGRIDRLGQKADQIHIWNLYFADTIDARIVQRLLERIKIFQDALGLSEAIIGEHIKNLEYTLLMRPLTAKQIDEQIDKAAMAIENALRYRDDLEKNAPHMMAHGQKIIEQIEATNELSRRVTHHDLYIYVRDYLNKFDSGFRFIQEENDKYTVSIQLSSSLAARLEEFCREKGFSGKTALSKGVSIKCHFLNKISHHSKRNEEIIHQFHPMIHFIAHDIKKRDEHIYPVVAVQVNTTDLENKFPVGIYAFIIRLWIFNGIREDEFLVAQARLLDQQENLSPEKSEYLIQKARITGSDWINPIYEQDFERIQQAWDACRMELQRRYDERKNQKILENSDRAQIQLDAIERHLQSQTQKKVETIKKHEDAGRVSLAKAVQGQIDQLIARMNTKIERTKCKGQIAPESNFVCQGLISVHGDTCTEEK